MRKILIVPTLGLGLEGITSVIYNYASTMDRRDLQLHFMTYGDLQAVVQERFERLGRIEIVPDRKRSTAAYIKAYLRLLKNGSFDVVHVHGNSGTMAIEAVLAKVCGVPKVIVHTHSTKTSHPVINAMLKYPMMACADTLMACSDASGKWLYNDREFTVLNNAIDISGFRYAPDIREQCRGELGIGDEFLIGHIGHFSETKNHFFLIDIFHAVYRRKPDARLLLVGDGPDFDAVVEKVDQLRLRDAVIIAGRRTDVERLYQAMDAFVLPSRWEGLPLVLLEAQASGLPVIASDRITRDVCCSEHFWYMNIGEDPEVWAEKLIKLSEELPDRTGDTARQLRQSGFDIHLEAERLREQYLY